MFVQLESFLQGEIKFMRIEIVLYIFIYFICFFCKVDANFVKVIESQCESDNKFTEQICATASEVNRKTLAIQVFLINFF